MTALVIKNLPEELLARLKERAKANQRSLTKEAIVVLSTGVGEAATAPAWRHTLPAPDVLASGPLKVEDAVRDRTEGAWPVLDGREALRAALVKQPDGSYINVLGIDDESFFTTLETVRSEIRLPDMPDFGDESH